MRKNRQKGAGDMLTCDETSFRLHGKKFHIYSGAMHYFRILPQYWEDRLQKLKVRSRSAAASGFHSWVMVS